MADSLVCGHHLGVAVYFDGHWDDFVVEASFCRRDSCAPLTFGTESVEVFAGEAIFVGDHLSSDALRRQAGFFVTVLHCFAEGESHTLYDARSHWGSRHYLDTCCDGYVVSACYYALCRKMQGLLT